MNNKNCDKDEISNKYLLEKAWHLRDFEIERCWDRAKFFSLFLGGLSIYIKYENGNCNNNNNIFLKLGLSYLAIILSFIWYLVNRGSKAIYENWESTIAELQEYNIKCKTLSCDENYFKEFYIPYPHEPKGMLLGSLPISPARALILVSLISFIAFSVIFISFTLKINHSYFSIWNIIFCIFVCCFIVVKKCIYKLKDLIFIILLLVLLTDFLSCLLYNENILVIIKSFNKHQLTYYVLYYKYVISHNIIINILSTIFFIINTCFIIYNLIKSGNKTKKRYFPNN